MFKKLMILGAGILQLPAIRKAKEMGLQVVAVDMDPQAIGFAEEGIAREVISTIDIPGVLEAARRHGIHGIMTLASDMPMRTVAAVAKEMGLVGITEDTAVKATNKAAMRQALQDHGVPIPKFFKVSDEAQYRQAAAQMPGAFMVKPADNSGSRGVIKVEDPQNIADVEAAYDYSRGFSRSGDVVVEEYMQGSEVSVETLTVDGVCHVIQITDKLTTGAPYFVEMGHSQPTAHGPEAAEQIRQVAIAANRAIGIQNGPSHTEIMVTPDGPKVVELGARLGGDCITTHLIPLSTGVDMVECCIRIALGQTPELEPTIQKGSAIRYFYQTPGVVKAITGLETAENLPQIRQISIVHGVGQTVKQIRSSGDRLGFVIAQGRDACDAVAACRRAIEQIHITIE